MPPGVKHDQGKQLWHLFPFQAAGLVVDVLTWAIRPKEEGGRGYPPNNWKLVPKAKQRYFDAAVRHLAAWHAGERVDKDSGLPTLAHAACDVLFVLAFDQQTDGAVEVSTEEPVQAPSVAQGSPHPDYPAPPQASLVHCTRCAGGGMVVPYPGMDRTGCPDCGGTGWEKRT